MAEPAPARQGGSGSGETAGRTATGILAEGATAGGTGPEGAGAQASDAEGTVAEETVAEETVVEETVAGEKLAPQPAGAGAQAADGENPEEPGKPVIRDKRRLDPQTGQVRAAYASTEPEPGDASTPAASQTAGQAADGSGHPAALASGPHLAELEAARAVADERLVDLQRLQAEYVNYRRRVDRDRDVARDSAVASVLEALLPVLDDVHLARQHGDLEGGPFAAIAEKLEATLGRVGLARYGEPGEPFDPKIHEALLHTEAELAEGTTETTVVQILQPGYRAGERILRAARVAVADPR